MSVEKKICFANSEAEGILKSDSQSSFKRLLLTFELAILTLSVLACLLGCGPTRKEYAINEALLIDQTRSLEDQLYRAHFQIQRLERENQQLQAKLNGENPENQSAAYDGDKSDLEFDFPVSQNRGYSYPNGSRVVAAAPSVGQQSFQSAQLSNNRRVARKPNSAAVLPQNQIQNKSVRSYQQPQTGYYR